MSRGNIFLVLVALAFATLIGPEQIPEEQGDISTKPQPIQTPQSPIHSNLGELRKNQIQIKDHAQINQQTFAREFRSQAINVGLFECLSQYQASPHSALYELVLLKSGVVLQVKESGRSQKLPKCAEDSMMNMTFPQTAESITSDSHTIIWRVDW